jgi:hypothetical protein
MMACQYHYYNMRTAKNKVFPLLGIKATEESNEGKKIQNPWYAFVSQETYQNLHFRCILMLQYPGAFVNSGRSSC